MHVVSDTQPIGEVCTPATLTNTGTADATNDDPVTATAGITIQCPDLEITKVADSPSTVTAGGDVGFTITVSNDGPGTALGATLNDPLPAVTGSTGRSSPRPAAPRAPSLGRRRQRR